MTTWHPDPEHLDAYAGGRVALAHAASLEAHVVTCDPCREALRPALPADRLAAQWDGVLERLDAPAATVLERVLGRCGVAPHTARLVAVSPALRGSWVTALALVLLFAALAGRTSAGRAELFLLLAPLLPVLGVAAAYGPDLDPVHEVAAAAPYRLSRLVLLRSALVVSVTAGLSLLVESALPPTPVPSAAWLLPALALVLLALALGTVMDPLAAVAAAAATWVASAALVLAAGHGGLSLYRAPALGAALAVAVLSGAVLAARAHSLAARSSA